MSIRYELPCPCGGKALITPSAAGQEVPCPSCAQPLQAPTLLGIKRLQPAAEEAAPGARAARPWSPLQSMLFAVGVLVAVVSLGLGAYDYYLLSRVQGTTKPELKELHWMVDYDKLTPEGSLEVWNQLRFEGIKMNSVPPDQFRKPAWLLNREYADTLRQHALFCLLSAGLGVALAVGSFFLDGRTV